MTRITTIELDKDYLKFSAAHFTIFSATERERLHGHNFKVMVRIVSEVGDNGMCVDYSLLKKKVVSVCHALDEYTIIPSESPYLNIKEEGAYYYVQFNDEVLVFLKNDTLLIPIRNTTVEDFSWYILQELLGSGLLELCPVNALEVWVSSGPGQKGCSNWEA